MKKTGIFYGSTTGTTESVARLIAEKLGVSPEDVHDVSKLDAALVESYEALILGTSTWGDGELQDDWYDGIKVLKNANLSGKTMGGRGPTGITPTLLRWPHPTESWWDWPSTT